MQNKKRGFLFLLSLIAVLCFSNLAIAGGGEKKKKQKRPKNTGIISIKTTPNALAVRIDGKPVGTSGVTEAAEFYVEPGIHVVEIEGPNGKKFTKEINVVKNVKNCICLNVVEKTITKPCPFDVVVRGPSSIGLGELATFFVENRSGTDAVPLNYAWRITPSDARVTSGLGTKSITVDTSNLAGRELSVSVDVGDGINDASCRQTKSISLLVPEPPKPPPPPQPVASLCDEFISVAPDDDKARFDNCVIQLQSNPAAQLYIIVNQGTDRISRTRNSYTRVRKRALDYFVGNRNVPQSNITIVKGPDTSRTTYKIWVVPPGASLPPLR